MGQFAHFDKRTRRMINEVGTIDIGILVERVDIRRVHGVFDHIAKSAPAAFSTSPKFLKQVSICLRISPAPTRLPSGSLAVIPAVNNNRPSTVTPCAKALFLTQGLSIWIGWRLMVRCSLTLDWIL